MEIQHVAFLVASVPVQQYITHSVKLVNLYLDQTRNMFALLVKKVILADIVNNVLMAFGAILWPLMGDVYRVSVHQLVQYQMFATNKLANVYVKKALLDMIAATVHQDMW